VQSAFRDALHEMSAHIHALHQTPRAWGNLYSWFRQRESPLFASFLVHSRDNIRPAIRILSY
jgi:hypothetical protein